MLQDTQNLKRGKLEIVEVPVPAMSQGMILVRNYYSVISAGTEGRKVQTARKGYQKRSSTTTWVENRSKLRIRQ